MKLITLFLLLFIHPSLVAQVSITGTVTSLQGLPLPFASILVRSPADSSLVKGAVSDENGLFLVTQLKRGHYLLTIRTIGYKTKNMRIELTGDLEVEPIQLEEATTSLKEVTITAEKPLFEQKIDRLVVNVEGTIMGNGGSVLDILEGAPGISVDRQNGSMSMNGKQGVQVMINGKLQRLPLNIVVQQLESTNASGIQKIELVSNPSSRYDAEGDAGIINIVTKEKIDYGTTGTVSAGTGFSDVSGYFKPIGSFNLFHKGESISLQASYSMVNDRRWQQWNYERLVYSRNLYSNTITDRYASWPVHRASLAANWAISKRTSVNTLVSGFSDLWTMESFNHSKVTVDNVDSASIELYDRETNHWKHLMGSINITHQFSGSKKLSADADYLYYHDYNPNTFQNTYWFHEEQATKIEEVRTGKDTPIRMAVLKIDYETDMKGLRLEIGAKSTFSRLRNRLSLENKINELWIADPGFTQDYRLIDDVKAVYINVGGKLGQKDQFQVGLRAESTEMEIEAADDVIFSLDFWKLFPTAFYTLSITEESSLQFSYGRRITRPSYTQVAPFVIFMDPFTYYWGNLRLKPSVTDGIQGTYTYRDWMLTLKYSIDRNNIANNQSRYDDAQKRTYIFADNINKVEFYSLTAGIPFSITNWWKAQGNTLLTYQNTNHNHTGIAIQLEQYAARMSMNNSFKLPASFTIELSALYASATRVGLSLRKRWGSVSAGIQKRISDRSKVNLTVTDIFWTRNSVYLTDNPVLGQFQETSYYNEPRVLRLSYTWTFGNNRLKADQQRSTASDAEQQRIN